MENRQKTERKRRNEMRALKQGYNRQASKRWNNRPTRAG